MYRRRAGRSLVNIPDSVGGKQLTNTCTNIGVTHNNASITD